MKFGKRLLQSQVLEWKGWYIDYKILKKQIKLIAELKANLKEDVKCTAAEEYFKVLITVQLAKASDFYDKMEKQYTNIVKQMIASKSAIISPRSPPGSSSELKSTLSLDEEKKEILKINNQVDHLRRFVVLNYIAMLKILKKHDKMTGYSLRNQFLPKLLSSSFCISKGLGPLLNDLDDLLVNINQRGDELNPPSSPTFDKSTLFPRGGINNNCPICLSILINPVELSCKHVFCFACLSKAAEQKQSNCPVCRKNQVIDPLEFEIEKILEGNVKFTNEEDKVETVGGVTEAKLEHSLEYFYSRFNNALPSPPLPHCLIIGNRGCHIGSGNSTASFEAAIACGVDMIKFDVQMCGSGELIVYSESMLENGIKIIDLPFETVREEVPFAILTLTEALDCINQRCVSYIDIKSDNCITVLAVELASRIVVEGWKADKILVGSYSHYDIVNLRKLLPKGSNSPFDSLLTVAKCCGIPIGLAFSFCELNVDYVEVNCDDIRVDFVEDAHKRGIRIISGVVDDDMNYNSLKQLGVDGVITNFPDEIITLQINSNIEGDNLNNNNPTLSNSKFNNNNKKRFTAQDALSSLIHENKDKLEEIISLIDNNTGKLLVTEGLNKRNINASKINDKNIMKNNNSNNNNSTQQKNTNWDNESYSTNSDMLQSIFYWLAFLFIILYVIYIVF